MSSRAPRAPPRPRSSPTRCAARATSPTRACSTAALSRAALGRPLLARGRAGRRQDRGRQALARSLGHELIRLQCYEGHRRRAGALRMGLCEATAASSCGSRATRRGLADLYAEEFLIERPLLKALRHAETAGPAHRRDRPRRRRVRGLPPRIPCDFQISIPEIGTIKAARPPVVVLTSNRTRELHEALRRRCIYHWIAFPTRRARRDHHARARARAESGRRAGWSRRQRPPPPAAGQGAGHRRGGRLGARRRTCSTRAGATGRRRSAARSARCSRTRRISSWSKASSTSCSAWRAAEASAVAAVPGRSK